MIIPDRRDLPRHVTNMLNEAQLQAYTKECLEMRAYLKCDNGINYLLWVNSFGEYVLVKNDETHLILKPKLILDRVTLAIHKLMSIERKCEYKGCEWAVFGCMHKNNKIIRLCRRHYQIYLETNFKGECSEVHLSSEMHAKQDLNGNYYAVGLRNRLFDTVEFILVDDEDLEFVNIYRPFYVNGAVTVKYTTVDGIKHTARLYRVLLARALYGVYDHRLLNKYLQVDHLDRNPFNNRIVNLRLCTAFENGLNSQKFDLLRAQNKCHGFGVREIRPNDYEIKAYRLNERSFAIPVEIRHYDNLQIGLAWKNALEEKLMREIGVFDLLTPPIQYIEVKPVDTIRKAM